jgi:hypothetical protein
MPAFYGLRGGLPMAGNNRDFCNAAVREDLKA